MIEPGRARRRDLRLEIEIGACREHEGRTFVLGATEAANLDDAAIGWSAFKGVDVAKADMVRAPVDAIDDGIGFAGQLIMQALDRPDGR